MPPNMDVCTLQLKKGTNMQFDDCKEEADLYWPEKAWNVSIKLSLSEASLNTTLMQGITFLVLLSLFSVITLPRLTCVTKFRLPINPFSAGSVVSSLPNIHLPYL